MLEFLPQHKMHPDSSATTQEESESVSDSKKGGLTSLRNHKRFTAVPEVTERNPEFPTTT